MSITPIFMIWGLKQNDELAKQLQAVVEEIPELELESSDVHIRMIEEGERDDKPRSVIVMVEGLYKTEKRTPRVRNLLADKIKKIIVKFSYPSNVVLVQVYVKELDFKKDGFAQWELKCSGDKLYLNWAGIPPSSD
jgi:hypothetical protein